MENWRVGTRVLQNTNGITENIVRDVNRSDCVGLDSVVLILFCGQAY